MSKPDKSNDKPLGRPAGTPEEDSLTSRVARMQVGQVESKSIRIPLTQATPDNVKSSSAVLSATVRTAVTRAKQRDQVVSKNKFTTVTGNFVVPNNELIVTCVITRIK